MGINKLKTLKKQIKMNTLRNKLIRLIIIERTTDELPNYPGEVAEEIMKIYESSDNDLIRNIQSLMDYYKSQL